MTIEPSALPRNILVEEGRIGTFSVPRRMIRNCPADNLFRFFANFIIVRAELLYATDSVEYVAYSPLFSVVDAGEEAPTYTISMEADGSVRLENRGVTL